VAVPNTVTVPPERCDVGSPPPSYRASAYPPPSSVGMPPPTLGGGSSAFCAPSPLHHHQHQHQQPGPGVGPPHHDPSGKWFYNLIHMYVFYIFLSELRIVGLFCLFE